MMVGTIPEPGLQPRRDLAVGADDEHLGLPERAHEERAARADDDVAQIAIEHERARRGARPRPAATRARRPRTRRGAVARRLVDDPARRRAHGAPRAHGRPSWDRGSRWRRRGAATTCTRPASSSITRPGSSPAWSAVVARTVLRREVDEVHLIALGIGRHDRRAVRERQQRPAAERRHGRRWPA